MSDDLPTLRISCDGDVPARSNIHIELDGRDITPWVAGLQLNMAPLEQNEVKLALVVGQVTVDAKVMLALESELQDIRRATIEHHDG